MGFKYKYYNSFGKLYNYGLKHFNPYNMMAEEAFGAQGSTLFDW